MWNQHDAWAQTYLPNGRKHRRLPFSDTATEPTTTRSTFTFESRPIGTLKSLTPWGNLGRLRNKIYIYTHAAFLRTKLNESHQSKTWEEEHMRSCSLLAPCGGVIRLKRPVRRRGVGTNNVFCACGERAAKETNHQRISGVHGGRGEDGARWAARVFLLHSATCSTASLAPSRGLSGSTFTSAVWLNTSSSDTLEQAVNAPWGRRGKAPS